MPRLLQIGTVGLLVACLPFCASACGGYIEGMASGTRYTISSPNYPGSYDRNTNCVWLYAATNFTELRVNVSSMQLETNTDGSCKDYVLITEGSVTANEVGRLCSSSSPKVLTTLSRYLRIQFRSDFQNQDRGFQLTVIAVGNLSANGTDSPVTACQLTQYSCPNKECIDRSYLCDSVNDCGCDDYTCDETVCWTFTLLKSIGFNWGVGIGIGFFIGLLMLVIFGLYEMPQHKRPDCLKRNRGIESQENVCLLACAQRCKRNKVDQKKPGDQFKSMLEKMSAGRHPLRWETESESDMARSGGPSRSASRRSSASGPGSQGGSRRSSYQLSVSAASYGNTLSPRDRPPPPLKSVAPAATPAAGTSASGSAARTAVTLTVPTTSRV